MKGDTTTYAKAEKVNAVSIFPNPFNSYTTLEYELLNYSNVCIELYNNMGEKIKELQKTTLLPGKYHLTIKDEDMTASGLYYVRIISDNEVRTFKLWHLKE